MFNFIKLQLAKVRENKATSVVTRVAKTKKDKSKKGKNNKKQHYS